MVKTLPWGGQEASTKDEKGGLGDAKCLPKASQNDKKMKLRFQSVLESEKDATTTYFPRFWEEFGVHFGSQNSFEIDPKIDDIFDVILKAFQHPKYVQNAPQNQ